MMKSLLVVALLGTYFFGQAQVKVVIMGSSTAAGSAATSYNLAWAGRMTAYYNQNTTDGLDTSFVNIARVGLASYDLFPTEVNPTYPNNNITRAFAENPQIIVLNLPNNDIAYGYSKQVFMYNLRYLYSAITARGIKCFVTTTQPRNDLTDARRDSLRTMVDSINNTFRQFAVNFWDDLVTNDGQNRLRDDVRHIGFPDADYHLNDLGHSFVFARIRDKNIFAAYAPLPVKITSFQAKWHSPTVQVNWSVADEEPNTKYVIQRSGDARQFETVYEVMGTGAAQLLYNWTDRNPLAGNSYYRLQVREFNRDIFSNTIRIANPGKGIAINKLYKNSSSSELLAELTSSQSKPVSIRVVTVSGSLAYQERVQLTGNTQTISIPISKLATGQYIFSIIPENGKPISQSFIR